MNKKVIAMFTSVAMLLSMMFAVSAEPADVEEFEPESTDIEEAETKPKSEPTWCGKCNDIVECVEETCDNRFFPGDVNGDGKISGSDVTQITMYLAGIPSSMIVRGGPGSRAWNAASVTGGDKPAWWDIWEIQAYNMKLPSVLNGMELLPVERTILKAELDEREGIIRYYTAEDLVVGGRYEFEIEIIGVFGEMKLLSSNDIMCNLSGKGGVLKGEVRGPVSEGTEIASHHYKVSKEVSFIGDVFSQLAAIPIRLGDVNEDGSIDIKDAMEILTYLAKITSSKIYNCERAFAAACITGKETPVIGDVLQILMYISAIEGSQVK